MVTDKIQYGQYEVTVKDLPIKLKGVVLNESAGRLIVRLDKEYARAVRNILSKLAPDMVPKLADTISVKPENANVVVDLTQLISLKGTVSPEYTQQGYYPIQLDNAYAKDVVELIDQLGKKDRDLYAVAQTPDYGIWSHDPTVIEVSARHVVLGRYVGGAQSSAKTTRMYTNSDLRKMTNPELIAIVQRLQRRCK